MSKEHYNNIDGLRSFACLGIVALHLLGVDSQFMLDGYIWNRVIPQWTLLVDLFMLISGFGICAGYLNRFQENKISLEQFYMRRWGKILPFFAIITLIGIIAEHSLSGLAEGTIEISLLFGLLPNNSNCFEVNGVCWTMGTIFAFYIVFPFISCLLKNRCRAWLSFAGSVIIAVLCDLYFMTDKFVVEDFKNRSSILYALPIFMAGCLIYLYRAELSKIVRKLQWLILIVCLLLSVAYYILPDEINGYEFRDAKAIIVFSAWMIYALGGKV